MTLAIAWVRSVGATEELVVASDSRLRWGRAWDCCPKILLLPRTDCVICFAGSTFYAYPLMLQMVNAIRMFPPSTDRSTSLEQLKGHTLRMFERMTLDIHDFPRPKDAEKPDTLFLLAGYSWRESRFRIWTLHYDSAIKRFTYRPHRQWGGVAGDRMVAFVGDEPREAKSRLLALLKKRGELLTGGFNMEPLEVLCDIIREGNNPLIGGPPQVVKVYRHLNVKPFGMYWPTRESGTRTVMGRTLLGYETPDCTILDPDTLFKSVKPGS